MSADPTVTGQQSYVIDRGEQVHSVEAARNLAAAARTAAPVAEEEPQEAEAEAEAEFEAEAEEAAGDGEREAGRRRRRRGRGRGRGRGEAREEEAEGLTQETAAEHAVAHEDHDAASPEEYGDQEGEGAEGEAAVAGETDEQRENRRRRRRGRRGGRRNRRGRNGEGSHEGPFENGEGEAEAELQHAVENLDRQPSWEERAEAQPAAEETRTTAEHAMRPSTAEAEFPAPVGHEAPEAIVAEAEAEAVEEAEAAAERQRRRSTVRERAPIPIEGAQPMPSPTLPPPTPVISISSSEEPAQPKRGWWGRRMMGDKD